MNDIVLCCWLLTVPIGTTCDTGNQQDMIGFLKPKIPISSILNHPKQLLFTDLTKLTQ